MLDQSMPDGLCKQYFQNNCYVFEEVCDCVTVYMYIIKPFRASNLRIFSLQT